MTPRIKPRNPYCAAALFRQAGAHRKGRKAQRRNDKLSLARGNLAIGE